MSAQFGKIVGAAIVFCVIAAAVWLVVLGLVALTRAVY